MNYNYRKLLRHCQLCGNLTQKRYGGFKSDLVYKYFCKNCTGYVSHDYYKSKRYTKSIVIYTSYGRLFIYKELNKDLFIIRKTIDWSNYITFDNFNEFLNYHKKLKKNLEFI